jgi:heptaprenyl diphosphate synthase
MLFSDKSPRRTLTHRLVNDALLLCAALMLSYLEAILPLGAIIPLPGFRLGLAQLVVTLAFFRVGRTDAAVISAARVAIMGVLFGNAGSLWFSLCGAILSYLGLCAGYAWLRRRCSYIGLGVLCAALHNTGQALAAATMFGAGILLSYLPILLVAAIPFGALGGVILNLALPRISSIQGGHA